MKEGIWALSWINYIKAAIAERDFKKILDIWKATETKYEKKTK